jgi:hypothetical protein
MFATMAGVVAQAIGVIETLHARTAVASGAQLSGSTHAD